MKNYITPLVILLSSFATLSAQFSEKVVVFSGSEDANEVYAADINNDGLNDLIGCTSSKVLLFVNQGNHSYNTVTIESETGANFYSTHTADLDGDGLIDILSSSEGNGNISWYRNLGNNSFSAKNIIDSGSKSRDVITTDIDDDGDIDIVANLYQSFSTDLVVYYENQGDGTFGSRVVINNEGGRIDCILPFDIDDDGDKDIFSTSLIGDQVWMMENMGNGNFATAKLIAENVNGAQSMDIADYNNDGKYDIVVATRNSASRIVGFSYNGDGTFTEPERIFFIITNSQINTVFLKDLDLDGNLEICMADDNASTVSYLKNLGSNFASSATIVYSNATRASCVYADDLDGDGDSEILYSLGEGQEIGYFINNTIISSTEDTKLDLINIFPNPASDYIEVGMDVEIIDKIMIYAIDGSVLLESSNPKTNRIDLRSFVSGTYVLNITTGDKNFTQTIVKK